MTLIDEIREVQRLLIKISNALLNIRRYTKEIEICVDIMAKVYTSDKVPSDTQHVKGCRCYDCMGIDEYYEGAVE